MARKQIETNAASETDVQPDSCEAVSGSISWQDQFGFAGELFEQLGRRASVWTARNAARSVSGLCLTLLLIGTGAAQSGGAEACQSGFGQFAQSLTTGTTAIVSTLVIAVLAVGILLVMIPMPGTSSVGYMFIGAFVVAVVLGILGYSVYDMGSAHMPIGPDQTCGSVTG